MSNTPKDAGESHQQILSSEEFLQKLNEFIKKGGRWAEFDEKKFKEHGYFVCQDAMSACPEFAMQIIAHSQQNGVDWGMDINVPLDQEGQTLLTHAVRCDNYEIFKKLLSLNANPFAGKDSILATVVFVNTLRSTTSEESTKRLEIRTPMLRDLLAIGVPVDKHTFEYTLRHSDVSMLRTLAESESGKKLITVKFLKSILEDESIKYGISGRSDMQTELMRMYHKQRTIETLSKSTESSESEKLVAVGREDMKKTVIQRLKDPRLQADIIEEIIQEYGTEILDLLVSGLRKHYISHPDILVTKLLR